MGTGTKLSVTDPLISINYLVLKMLFQTDQKIEQISLYTAFNKGHFHKAAFKNQKKIIEMSIKCQKICIN